MTGTAIKTNGEAEPVPNGRGFGRAFAKLYAERSEYGHTRHATKTSRFARVERIRANIAAYPSKSICFAGSE